MTIQEIFEQIPAEDFLNMSYDCDGTALLEKRYVNDYSLERHITVFRENEKEFTVVTTVELRGGYIDWDKHRIWLWEVLEQIKKEK